MLGWIINLDFAGSPVEIFSFVEYFRAATTINRVIRAQTSINRTIRAQTEG